MSKYRDVPPLDCRTAQARWDAAGQVAEALGAGWSAEWKEVEHYDGDGEYTGSEWRLYVTPPEGGDRIERYQQIGDVIREKRLPIDSSEVFIGW